LKAQNFHDEIVRAFQNDSRLQNNLQQSLIVILRFYGLQRYENSEGKIVIDRASDYSIRKREWVSLLDHNYFRITRILKCLMAFGLLNEAQAFYDCLKQIYKEDSEHIGGETFQYWTNAIKTETAARS
jgi:hypothetical protein